MQRTELRLISMAATNYMTLSVLLVLGIFSVFSNAYHYQHPLKVCKFTAIYQLGDSMSDTGNLIRESPSGAGFPFAHLPYGKTRQSLFKNVTGRCSNGLLMIDFIAKSAGVPLLEPYLKRDGRFGHGVNFAVAGSTALTSEVLAESNVVNPVTNSSLSKQLHWMTKHFNTTCLDHHDCVEKHKSALFMVGEIGGNDYNYALFGGKTIEDTMKLVPDVIKSIKHAVKKVIHHGAKRVIVPGNFPIGCFPIYLTSFHTNDSTAYDEFHCLKGLNEFATYHNDRLQEAIKDLRQEHPDATIVYGDYYNAFQFLYRFAALPWKRFETDSLQKACCGTGGDYNFSLARMCGFPDVSVCPNPGKRISWDGVHLTERSYYIMARWLIADMLPQLQCIPN